MNTTLRWSLVIVLAVAVALALVLGGAVLGRFVWGMPGFGPAGVIAGYGQTGIGLVPYGYGMMGYNYGQVYTSTVPYGYGMMGPNMMGMMGGGMMGGWGANSLYAVRPLSLAEARAAVENYLANLGNEDLALREVMIFDNHAYAEVVEKSTGIGAFEVLVDPVTRAVFPEPGPNMMWNTKYGHMSGVGMMGMMGMMRPGGMPALRPAEIPAKMPVSPDQAVATAQRYLDAYLPGAQAGDEADAFYGYYTIHILRDGQTVGMLSVNGYTRQVFVHTWHGDFVEMTEETHD